MIILFNYGRMLGLPDPSPFVFKAELMLRMANLHRWKIGDRSMIVDIPSLIKNHSPFAAPDPAGSFAPRHPAG